MEKSKTPTHEAIKFMTESTSLVDSIKAEFNVKSELFFISDGEVVLKVDHAVPITKLIDVLKKQGYFTDFADYYNYDTSILIIKKYPPPRKS